MERWRHRHAADSPVFASRIPVVPNAIDTVPTTREFSLAVGLVGMVVVAGTTWGTLDTHGIGGLVYAMVLGGYTLHALVHVALAVLVRGYAPGVLTAIVLIPPTAVYLYSQLFAAGVLTPRTAVVTAIGGVLLVVPLVALSHAASTALTTRHA